VGGGMWMLQHRSAQRSSSPPVASAPQTAPVDPTAETVRLAQQALQSQDYAAAERYADMVLKQAPQHAEARRIRGQAHDALVAAALDKARSLMASGDFGEASRAAGEALALAPGNTEAKNIMEQASARMRGRGADEARTRTAEARSAAQAAGAPRLASVAFRSAARAEQDALRLYKAGRLAEAMTRFYEASGLYRSAESNARTEQAAAAAAAAAAPPVQAPAPAPAPTPSQSASQPPPQTAPADKPAAPPEPAPTTAPASQLPKPPASQLPKPAETVPAPPAAPSTTLKSTPPPTQPTPELPSRSPTAEDRIGELLNRYKGALEARSLDDLRRVWPTLSGAPQDAIRNEFQHSSRITVTLVDPQIQASGLAGVVTFLRRYDIVTVEGQRLHSEARTTMEVRRTPSGAWVIDSIRFTPVR
jgi:tetratricopeptide (TPR) repeat protein